MYSLDEQNWINQSISFILIHTQTVTVVAFYRQNKTLKYNKLSAKNTNDSEVKELQCSNL